MEQIIKAIDDQIAKMKTDSSIWVTPLNELLIQLSKEQWKANKEAKTLKTSYEMEYISKKEEREEHLNEKKEKVTDAELKRYADKELIDDYVEYKANEAIGDYLKPIVEAYVNYVAGFKSDRNEWTKIEKMY